MFQVSLYESKVPLCAAAWLLTPRSAAAALRGPGVGFHPVAPSWHISRVPVLGAGRQRRARGGWDSPGRWCGAGWGAGLGHWAFQRLCQHRALLAASSSVSSPAGSGAGRGDAGVLGAASPGQPLSQPRCRWLSGSRGACVQGASREGRQSRWVNSSFICPFA